MRFSPAIAHIRGRQFFLATCLWLGVATMPAVAQTTSGDPVAGQTLYNANCSGCHPSATSLYPALQNAANAGGVITNATASGMGGYSAASFNATQENNLAAWVNSLTSAIATQSVPHNTATAISISNLRLNSTYSAFTSMLMSGSPARGSVPASSASTSVTYTPTTGQCGTDTFTVQGSNSGGTIKSSVRTITVSIANPAVPNISTSSSAINGTAAVAISTYSPVSTGGTPTSYSISIGTLPTGLSLNTITGAITGTPSASGTTSVTLSAFNCAGGVLAGQSGTRSITITVITVPGAPTIGTATPGNAQLSVAFTAPASNGNSTILDYTATCGAFSTTGAGSPLVVTGLTNGTAYTCTVKARNASGSSAASSASASATPRTVPGAPTIGTTTPGNAQLSVAFTAPASNGGSAITGYTATCGGFTNTGASSPIVVSGLTNGTGYTCSVTATNVAGTGSASSASASATPRTVPGAPTIGTATPGNAQLSVAFTAPVSNGGSAITSYTATCGGISNAGASSPIVVSTLTNGTSYTCTVTATNAAGAGTASSASASATPRTVPGAPTIGTATAGNAQISVTFTAPVSNGGSAITSYSATCGGISNSGAASPIVVSGLTNGTSYTCTVAALNAAGTSASSTASNSATPVTVPAAPTIGTATAGNTQVSVAFTAGSTGGSPITSFTATCGGTSNTGASSPILIAGLTNGTSYTCTVTATNAIGTSPSSATSNSVVPAGLPGAPVIGTATAGNTQISVTFSAPGSNGGSAITAYRATCGVITNTGATSPIVVSGLTNGTAYACTVAATNANGTGIDSAAANSATPSGPQTISFGTAPTPSYAVGGTFSVSATASSGLTPTYSSNTPATCSVASGSTINTLAVGTCTIAANQAGNAAFSAAPTVTQNITISTGTQTITFGAVPSPTFAVNGTFSVSASGGGSVSPVVFSTLTASTCSVTGSTVRMLALGVCTIAANQAGDANFSAAPQATQTIQLGATSYVITNFAGGNPAGNDVAATTAPVNQPRGIAMDSSGNLYVSEQGGARIRKVTPAGIITTIAGNGVASYAGDGGVSINAQINNPRGMTIDNVGNLYIADTNNNRVRRIDPNGTMITFAGNGSATYSGDGGQATAAGVAPWGVAADAAGNIYIAELVNNRIRKVDPSGIITTVVGTGTPADTGDGGSALLADIDNPQNVTVDSVGNLYVLLPARHKIRKVDINGNISTFAGTGTAGSSGDGGQASAAQLDAPTSMVIDSAGNMYISDINTNRVRKIDTTGVITSIAGTGTASFSGDGSAATAATLNQPSSLWIDSNNTLYITDQANSRVRSVSGGIINTIAGNGTSLYSGDGGSAANAHLLSPYGLVFDTSGNLYVSERGSRSGVRKISAAGSISTLAGNGSSGFADGNGTAAAFNLPSGLAIDASGNILVADRSNHRIRQITPAGDVTTIAGNGTSGFFGDTGPATAARLASPNGVAIDAGGSLYIADGSNNRIRKVSGGTINTFAGTGTVGFFGDGNTALNAQFTVPQGVALDASGNVYVADTTNRRIRKIDTGLIVSTVAGNGAVGNTGDGGPATSAAIGTANGVGLDAAGNLYISTTSVIRRVDTGTATISSFAGNANLGDDGDGGAALSAGINGGNSVVAAADGSFYFADTNNNRIRRVFYTTSTVPGAPGSVNATAGNAQISVAFAAPASNGGSPVTRYMATCGTSYAYGTSSPVVVSNLINGATYTCSVTATNAIGTGSATAATSATPQGAPGAPLIGVATSGINQVSITFTPPAFTGGSSISSYTATCGTQSATGTASPIVVTGLAAGVAVSCTVNASNATATSVSSAASNSVTPIGVPGAPVIGVATPGNTVISVAFSAPASNGASPITGYTATCGVVSASGAASPITVLGLVNGVSYTCSVSATNAAGTGPASANSNSAIPATVPDAPVIGTATAIGGSDVAVTFTPPAIDGGGVITGYVITCGANTATVTASPGTVSGLPLGVPVSCTVAARNAAGTGAASAASNMVTPNNFVPGAPTIGSVVAGVASVTVNFTPPAFTGNAGALMYTATCGTQSATGSTSPIVVSGLANGSAVTCTVIATNTNGSSTASAVSNSVTPEGALLNLVNAYSRKTHGTVGDFDLLIDASKSITDDVTIESRSGAAGHVIAFEFDAPVTVAGSANAFDANGQSLTANATALGNWVLVSLSGVTDASRVTVFVSGVNEGQTFALVSLGFLLGDVNGSGKVDATDAAIIRPRSGLPVDSSSYRMDLNMTGVVTAADIAAVKARNGVTLP